MINANIINANILSNKYGNLLFHILLRECHVSSAAKALNPFPNVSRLSVTFYLHSSLFRK